MTINDCSEASDNNIFFHLTYHTVWFYHVPPAVADKCWNSIHIEMKGKVSVRWGGGIMKNNLKEETEMKEGKLSHSLDENSKMNFNGKPFSWHLPEQQLHEEGGQLDRLVTGD